jgi:large subunit ribosomal protein L3
MTKGILGRKVGMTQIFTEQGDAVPVTVIQAGPCHVLQIRTPDRDGYEAVQIGYGDKPRRLARRSERGHVAVLSSKAARKRSASGVETVEKADAEPKKFVREIRGPVNGAAVGQELKVDLFEGVAAVDVVGISKGRGFSGAMKRHNFSGQRATHGVKKCHRHMGGTSMATYPGRTFPGKKMPGQYGNTRVTSRNLKVVKIDAENNLLMVRGAVPGPNGGYVMVQETNKLR